MAARGEVDKEEGNNSGFMGEYGERGRYRNRVEFKGKKKGRGRRSGGVDIETEWNLKKTKYMNCFCMRDVDIETEWNLKQEKD